MRDHDPLCVTPYKQQATCASCVLVARVRADERARELQASRETALTVASNVAALERHHAEAVAARLVEVICEMQDQLDGERAVGAALLTAQQMAVRGRDMARADLEAADDARAEVAALARWKGEATAVIEAWEQVHTLLGSPGRLGESKAAATYAEVAALQVLAQDANEAFAAGRREVLADLRAKVEGLRDESIWARRGTVAENGLDTVPSAWHNGRTSLADAVLALIEEVQR